MSDKPLIPRDHQTARESDAKKKTLPTKYSYGSEKPFCLNGSERRKDRKNKPQITLAKFGELP